MRKYASAMFNPYTYFGGRGHGRQRIDVAVDVDGDGDGDVIMSADDLRRAANRAQSDAMLVARRAGLPRQQVQRAGMDARAAVAGRVSAVRSRQANVRGVALSSRRGAISSRYDSDIFGPPGKRARYR